MVSTYAFSLLETSAVSRGGSIAGPGPAHWLTPSQRGTRRNRDGFREHVKASRPKRWLSSAKALSPRPTCLPDLFGLGPTLMQSDDYQGAIPPLKRMH